MAVIRIEWLSDSNDCDQCGGGYADGARVFIDGKLKLNLEPAAACYGSTKDWDREAVFKLIIEELGHTLAYGYGGDW